MSVSIGRDGLVIDGEPFYLLSGCVHYFRWPQAEWRPLLEQARWFGLNTIDTVIPWNRHEPRPGEFDFADEADLGAFLDLCRELGLKAIVRPGPYICAEWENGGLPAWLTAQDVALRRDDEGYMAATRRWLATLMTIIAPRQHSRGGPVILCQIENEHWASGVYAHDFHQASLAQAALECGIDVPQYTCMGAVRDWPEFRNGWSGIAEKLVQTRALWADNPMIVSELWSGWFDNWGASRQTRKSAAKLDMTLHQLAAVGCAGFSHWMWAGGTNFGFWGGRTVGGDTIHMTTSYDYDAPIDEYGAPRPKALTARRHHLFLGSFGAALSRVLDDAQPGGLTVIAPAAIRGRSEGGSAPYRTARAASTAPPEWRDFRCTFLQNNALEGATYQIFLPDGGPHLSVEVEPTSIRPIFCNMPLGTNGLRLSYHTGRILGFWPGANQDLLVIYGTAGEQGEIELEAVRPGDKGTGGQGDVETGAAWTTIRSFVPYSLNGPRLHIRYWITEEPGELRVTAGGRELRLLILTQEQAERFELPDAIPAPPPSAAQRSVIGLPLEQLDVLETSTDEGWTPIERPAALERLGCDYGYGWYRAELELDAPLDESLAAPWLSDRARVLLGGEELGVLGIGPEGPRYTLPLRLAAGRHDLRLLADNLGRFNYGVNLGELKGLLDTLYLGGAEEDISGGWAALWQEVQFAGEAVALMQPRALRPDAEGVDLRRFAFEGSSVWLLREVQAVAGRRYLAHITGDRNSGGFFVNGEAVERFSRHRSGGLIKADISRLLRPGPNLLAINIQNYAGAPWRATLISYDPQRPLKASWSFRAGVSVSQKTEDRRQNVGPTCYRTVFGRGALPSDIGSLRLRVGRLGKGQIWLNGRTIGRFWQIGPQEDYKLPVSWLAEQNELLIFAEEGRAQEIAFLFHRQS